jgi:phage shock protein E
MYKTNHYYMDKAFLLFGRGLWTVVCGLLLFAACSPDKKQQSESTATTSEAVALQKLEPQVFKTRLAETPGAVLLDVRTSEEIAQGAIPGSVPLDFKSSDFDARIDALDKDKPYFVYCAVGGRSGKTADLMKEKGFTQVYNLDGGFQAWQEQGLEQTKPN